MEEVYLNVKYMKILIKPFYTLIVYKFQLYYIIDLIRKVFFFKKQATPVFCVTIKISKKRMYHEKRLRSLYWDE